MFTGIITDVGRVSALEPAAESGGDLRVTLETSYDTKDIAHGASIACSGCCLTVVAKEAGAMTFDVSGETLSRTKLGGWRVGTAVNLERALSLGDELGGHMMCGHVDGTGRLVSEREEGGSWRLAFEAPRDLAPCIASKGSIAIDGVSLTVNEVDDCRFGVNIIPHTRQITTLGALKPDDPVNLEIDMLARYVARLMDMRD